MVCTGSGFPPSLIPTLRNIGVLHYKQAKLPKHLQHNVCALLLLVHLDENFFDAIYISHITAKRIHGSRNLIKNAVFSYQDAFLSLQNAVLELYIELIK